jgi:hypothetical protein
VRGIRHHLLSLVAVVLAAGAGVVWGSGPLIEQVHSTTEAHTRGLRSEQQELRVRIAALEKEARLGEMFVGTVSDPLATRQLTDRSVSIFVAPGARAAVVERTAKAITAAGASVTSTIRLTGDYVDPTKAVSPLEDLALRLVPPRVTFPSGASPIDRVSTVLARSTVTSVPDEAGRADEKGTEVLAGLEEIGALKVDGASGTLSELAVLVVGPPRAGAAGTGGAAASSASETLSGLALALDRASRGLVIVGPAQSARPAGVIAAIRGPGSGPAGNVVSTIDLADESMGPVAVVLALAENLRGRSGHYGAAPGARALLPPAVPASGP